MIKLSRGNKILLILSKINDADNLYSIQLFCKLQESNLRQ